MNLSLGEFKALVAKAFRGAGYSWGLTEEAAYACVQLAEFGIDAGSSAIRLLDRTNGIDPALLMPTDEWRPAGEVTCPVYLGSVIIDSGDWPDGSIDHLLEPILLAPFLLTLIESGSSDSAFTIRWDGGSCEVTETGLTIEGSIEPLDPGATLLTNSQLPPTPVKRRRRVLLDDEVHTAIDVFAKRTYAPATEASRLHGAGADDTD